MTRLTKLFYVVGGVLLIVFGSIRFSLALNWMDTLTASACWIVGLLLLFQLMDPARFLGGNDRYFVIEPVPQDAFPLQADKPYQSNNPYAPPQRLEDSRDNRTPTLAQRHQLRELFVEGQPFMHYGVVIFVDPEKETAIHVALPLREPTELLIQRNVDEALRVVPAFLGHFPDAQSIVAERQLVVRMIASYEDLDNEVSDRVILEPSHWLAQPIIPNETYYETL